MPEPLCQVRDNRPNVCVMRKAKGIIPKLNGKKGWPSLKEARVHLEIDDVDAHSAMTDAHSALAIFRYLKENGADLTPEVHFAANRPE